VVERARGRQPSPVKSLIAATIVGFAAAVATFGLLRSGAGKDENGNEAASGAARAGGPAHGFLASR
jgi:hypothetical protein